MNSARERVLSVSREVALELEETDVAGRTELMARFHATHNLDFFLFDNDGTQLGGRPVTLPAMVEDRLKEGQRPGADQLEPPPPPPSDFDGPPPDRSKKDGRKKDGKKGKKKGPRPGDVVGPRSVFLVTAGEPKRQWIGARIPVRTRGDAEGPRRGTLFMVADSVWTNPLFFDPRPLVVFAGLTLVVSSLCWLPLIRGLTHSVSLMTRATSQIAKGHFDVHVDEKRRDEIGSLGESINQMATRLEGYVEGQKMFLAGVAHELRSPLARMELEVELLGRGATAGQQEQLSDLREDVEHLRGLVDELMTFTKAGMRSDQLKLTPVNVAEAINRAVSLEALQPAQVKVEVDESFQVSGDRDYLFRALANLVRNAVRYAGEAGPATITARRDAGQIIITVSDSGRGVPEEALESIFKPFFRLETARDRRSGGTGLGLAIVKSSIEAMKGTVTARNLRPQGFAVEVRIPEA